MKRYICAATYNGFDESEFDDKQMRQIRKGLESGLDISQYADLKFDGDQMEEIRKGLESGVDVSWYADPKFNDTKMYEIRLGLESGVDVSQYADPKFGWAQMETIRKGLESGVDVSWYADPEFNWKQMREIKDGLEAGVDVSQYADPKFDREQMWEIREGLEHGVDVSQYADPKINDMQMEQIRKDLERNKSSRPRRKTMHSASGKYTLVCGMNYDQAPVVSIIDSSEVSEFKEQFERIETLEFIPGLYVVSFNDEYFDFFRLANSLKDYEKQLKADFSLDEYGEYTGLLFLDSYELTVTEDECPDADAYVDYCKNYIEDSYVDGDSFSSINLIQVSPNGIELVLAGENGIMIEQ